jgi:hypothetical protein
VETDFEKPETVMFRVSRGRRGPVKEGDNGFIWKRGLRVLAEYPRASRCLQKARILESASWLSEQRERVR